MYLKRIIKKLGKYIDDKNKKNKKVKTNVLKILIQITS